MESSKRLPSTLTPPERPNHAYNGCSTHVGGIFPPSLRNSGCQRQNSPGTARSRHTSGAEGPARITTGSTRSKISGNGGEKKDVDDSGRMLFPVLCTNVLDLPFIPVNRHNYIFHGWHHPCRQWRFTNEEKARS